MSADLMSVLAPAAAWAAQAPTPLVAAAAAGGVGLVIGLVLRFARLMSQPRVSAPDTPLDTAPHTPLPPTLTPAHAAFQAGDLDRAEEEAHAALSDADATGDLRGAGEALLTLSDVALSRGEPGEALTQALEAERRLVAVDSAPHLIAAHARQARALAHTPQRAQARADLEAARDRLLALGEPRMADDVDHWLAEAVARG